MTAQASGHFLVEEHHNLPAVPLRPDLLFTRAGKACLADTKWKIMENSNDISPHDMYQLFAYTETCLREVTTDLIYKGIMTKLIFTHKTLLSFDKVTTDLIYKGIMTKAIRPAFFNNLLGRYNRPDLQRDYDQLLFQLV